MRERSDILEGEVKKVHKIKEDIVEDFKQVKGGLTKTEFEMTELNLANEEIRKENVTLREQLNTTKSAYQELETEYNRVTIETYNLLYNIRHPFDSNVKLTASLNLQPRFDFHTDRYHSLLEVASMLGDITNLLNFEVKNVHLKDAQITELQQTITQMQEEHR